jgi:hypothetical protein
MGKSTISTGPWLQSLFVSHYQRLPIKPLFLHGNAQDSTQKRGTPLRVLSKVCLEVRHESMMIGSWCVYTYIYMYVNDIYIYMWYSKCVRIYIYTYINIHVTFACMFQGLIKHLFWDVISGASFESSCSRSPWCPRKTWKTVGQNLWTTFFDLYS